MQLDKYLIGLVIFSLVVLTGVLVMADMNANYDEVNMSTSEYSSVYDTINDTYDIAIGAREDTLGGEISDTATENSMFSGAYSAIRLVKNTFGIVGDISNAIAEEIGIPSFFIKAFMTIISILVIFALIYLVFRFKN